MWVEQQDAGTEGILSVSQPTNPVALEEDA